MRRSAELVVGCIRRAAAPLACLNDIRELPALLGLTEA